MSTDQHFHIHSVPKERVDSLEIPRLHSFVANRKSGSKREDSPHALEIRRLPPSPRQVTTELGSALCWRKRENSSPSMNCKDAPLGSIRVK